MIMISSSSSSSSSSGGMMIISSSVVIMSIMKLHAPQMCNLRRRALLFLSIRVSLGIEVPIVDRRRS